MTNGLPDNFAEDWGRLKSDIGHIKEQVDKTCEDFDDLPCEQKENNPLTEIAKLKSNFGFFKWLGGIMLTGMVGCVIWMFRKIMNGG